MALVVLPEGTQVSGSIGGTTYSHNRYGAYKRNRSVPVNPNTDRQVAIRNILRNLAIAWGQTLTQTQRDAWTVYAANVPWVNHLGQPINLTGEAHYIRSNAPRVQAGLPRVDDGPTIFELAQAEASLACTGSEATQVFTLTFDDTADWCDEDDAAELLSMGIPQDASIAFFNGPWRTLSPILGDSVAPPASPVNPATVWPFAQGQRIWIRTRITRADGRLSEFAQVNFLAAA